MRFVAFPYLCLQSKEYLFFEAESRSKQQGNMLVPALYFESHL